MLAMVFWVLLVIGGSAVPVLWAMSVRTAYQILTGLNERPAGSAWAMMVVWPFSTRLVAGAPPDKAVSLHKMLIGLFIAILVATGSLAVYSNLTFVPPPAARTLQ